jgi:hypothetical protein
VCVCARARLQLQQQQQVQVQVQVDCLFTSGRMPTCGLYTMQVRTLLQKLLGNRLAASSMFESVANIKEANGNVSFLPCKYHGVNAEQV